MASSSIRRDDDQEKDSDEIKEEYTNEALEIHAILKQNGSIWDAEFVDKQLNIMKNQPINIGVFGRSGSGKSSFINAIRRLKDTDDGAAEVDVVECTAKATSYPHPDNPNFLVWDIPGVGTEKHPKETYLKDTNFHMYDFYIILSCDRFTDTDLWLAQKVQADKKSFFFVRSKVDVAVRNDIRDRQEKHNKQEVLQRIRQDCEKQLKVKTKEFSSKIFLISNKTPDLFDFPKLVNQLIASIPGMKKDSLILALSAFDSPDALKEKRRLLRKRAWLLAVTSAAWAAVPIPGLGSAVDIALITSLATVYRRLFRITESDIKTRAAALGMNVEDIQKKLHLKSVVAETTAKGLQSFGVGLTTITVSTLLEEISSIVLPIVGSVIASGISYATTVAVLHAIIDIMYDDALKLCRVMAKKAKLETADLYIDKSFVRKVAILGETGTGKSSLVNALIGLKPSDPGAADVGVTETTRNVKAFKTETMKIEMCQVYDVPGVLTTTFPREKYLKAVKYKIYDIYIICSSPSLTECDNWLVGEILKLDKPVFVVRTKVDDNIEDAASDEARKAIPEKIRKNYEKLVPVDNEERVIGVYLVNTRDTSAFDFPDLLHDLNKCAELCTR